MFPTRDLKVMGLLEHGLENSKAISQIHLLPLLVDFSKEFIIQLKANRRVVDKEGNICTSLLLFAFLQGSLSSTVS